MHPVCSCSDTEQSKSRTLISRQLSVKMCLNCAREHPNVPSQNRDSSRVSIPRSKYPCILFYHLILCNSSALQISRLRTELHSGSSFWVKTKSITATSTERAHKTGLSHNRHKKDHLCGQADGCGGLVKQYCCSKFRGNCHLRQLPQILSTVNSICKIEQ